MPETILRSWQRCAGLGLDACGRAAHEPADASAVRLTRESGESLRRLCRPELEALVRDACETASMLIVTDADGLVLDACGNDDFMAKAARVALRPGANWREASAGTNAIGTALAERRPIAVRGAQHFLDANRILDCFAAPIHDPRGMIVGALDLSGPTGASHTHAPGLVRIAAEQIEHRYFDHIGSGMDILRFHSDPRLLGTAREGVLVFRDGQLQSANLQGLTLLGLDWQALDVQALDRLFVLPRRSLGEVSQLRSRSGAVFATNYRPASVQRAKAAPGNPAPAATLCLDPPLRARLERAVQMLDADVPVLLQGETGTGKEVCARELHARSRRASGPFIAFNCAAVPAGLIEAELFGYETGAFTGARREGSPGLVRRAAGGTLLLDEIGDMPLELQSRLLRVLQEHEVMALGGGKSVAVDFAVVCSTHRPLPALVRRGEFREDLYYRIAQYRLNLPPLREFTDLKATIARLWLGVSGGRHGSLSPEVLGELAARPWPGNFRQLATALRILVVHADAGETLDTGLLPWEAEDRGFGRDAGYERGDAPNPSSQAMTDSSLEDLERLAMQRALEASAGNVSAAARRLGVSRSTLYRRLPR